MRQTKCFEQKKCFFCGSKITKKNGVIAGVQCYKCIACGRQFRGGNRINNQELWDQYTNGKQTYNQLALSYDCSVRSVQRRLDTVTPRAQNISLTIANVVMDTSYWGKGFGVMVFKDSLTGTILFKQYVSHETNQAYLHGIQMILERGIKIQAIICDGRRGLRTLFSKDIPMQMCQFHQVATIRKYLTKNPKIQANKDLWQLTLLLVHTDKESFEGSLEGWYTKWKSFLNEQKVDEDGKKRYVHKILRSAYNSLKGNLPWLFTWQNNVALKIPNTTNALEGLFADLKNKLRNHNGLSQKRKKKFIDEFLKA